VTRRIAALAFSVALVAGACGSSVAPPSSGGVGSAGPAPGPTQPPRTAAPTPPTILALATADRPSGPWAVVFRGTGTPVVREVWLLSPACAQPDCDLTATIQTWTGEPIGTATFTFENGTYRLESDVREVIDCQTPVETITAGATRTTRTTLLIAGYRPAGTAVVSVDIRGTRSVAVTPVTDNGCAGEAIEYTANGEETELAAAPTPTAKPTPPPNIPGVGKSFFGAGVTVETYRVTGDTPAEILASIRRNGPYSDWAKARAEAVTQAVPRYRFELRGTGADCRIHVTTRPAIVFVYTITLPRWSQPSRASRSTVSWWTDEIQRVSRHERHHVELFRDGATRLSQAVDQSTCANVQDRLAKIAREINRQQCEFDLKEYGAAMGLTLASCLAN
jgi:predicted secreted Zn-dependent protease